MALEQIKDADFQQSVIESSNNQPVLVQKYLIFLPIGISALKKKNYLVF